MMGSSYSVLLADTDTLFNAKGIVLSGGGLSSIHISGF